MSLCLLVRLPRSLSTILWRFYVVPLTTSLLSCIHGTIVTPTVQTSPASCAMLVRASRHCSRYRLPIRLLDILPTDSPLQCSLYASLTTCAKRTSQPCVPSPAPAHGRVPQPNTCGSTGRRRIRGTVARRLCCRCLVLAVVSRGEMNWGGGRAWRGREEEEDARRSREQ